MTIKKYLDGLDTLVGKKILLTGGTSGIGLCLADHLLYKGADVVILARNPNKSLEVKDKLLEKHPNRNLDFISFDQSNFVSIEAAVKEIINKHQDFYALICNAGIFARNKKDEKGLSLTYKTNCVGLAYFLKLLVPQLHNKHRIIIQGSLAAGYHLKKIDSLYDSVSNWQQYLISKACVEMIYYHYAQMNLKDISFYLVEPGLTKTDIFREFPTPIKQLGSLFLKVASHSPSKAALTAVLALQEDVGPSFIVPRAFFTWRGYPTIKQFPKKRINNHLLELVNELI